MTPTTEPYALSPTDAARALSVGRSTVYKLISQGDLETTKIGTRTLVTTRSIKALAEPKTQETAQ
ncbi:MAG: helix-turn-helix domain-containing protein [Pseudomonadota bacterium]